MHESRVVDALEIDSRLIADPWLDDGVEPIAFADRGNCSWSTILEQLLDLVFAAKAKLSPSSALSSAQLTRRDAGSTAEHLSVRRAHDDALGQAVRRDAAGLGS